MVLIETFTFHLGYCSDFQTASSLCPHCPRVCLLIVSDRTFLCLLRELPSLWQYKGHTSEPWKQVFPAGWPHLPFSLPLLWSSQRTCSSSNKEHPCSKVWNALPFPYILKKKQHKKTITLTILYSPSSAPWGYGLLRTLVKSWVANRVSQLILKN